MYVLVAGAGMIGRQITRLLLANGHDVVVIEKDAGICESLYAETGVLTINGNATDIGMLEKAGALKADAILCLMGSSADNIACSLIAKSLGVPSIVARLKDPKYSEAYRLAGVTSIVRMADLLVNQIMMEVEQPKVKKIITLSGGSADVYAVRIPPDGRSIGMSIQEIAQKRNFPKECVFIGIYKEETGDFLIPRGGNVLGGGDMVFLVSKSQYITKATDFLTGPK
jgi:trk system potassium uptake protein TrkA